MKKISFLFVAQLLLFSFSCSSGNEHKVLEDEVQDFLPGMDRALFGGNLTLGLDLPELENYLSENEIENVAETLVNKPGTTQNQANAAMTLLNRMKKEDYEQTRLLMLKKRAVYNRANGDEKGALSEERRLKFFTVMFKEANKYEMSFARLSREVRKRLFDQTLKQLEKEEAD